ncbi:MAG: methyl-accepting chemotaxis protein [Roseateles depolymerans]|uniref:Methyl-accepting chemotaxis protein n=1 Tax=Roseateles depolymerans TaxID=76731 RepID=A0A2W5FU96_9BURK|nr:MAG: methyl-accepting chemotaxis protein [Roseateles depolymerans]
MSFVCFEPVNCARSRPAAHMRSYRTRTTITAADMRVQRHVGLLPCSDREFPVQFLTRISVGTKLGLAFLIVLLITATLGVLSILQLGRVNDTASDMGDNFLPSVRELQEVAKQATRYRTSEYRMTLAEPGAERKSAIESAQKYVQAVDEHLANYEKLPASPQEQAMLKQFKDSWAAYLENSRAFKAAAQADDEPKMKALLTGDGLTKFNAALQDIDALVAQNSKSSDEANALGDRIYDSSLKLTIAMTIAAIVIGAALAWGITRQITQSLTHSVKLAEAVAGGDLTHSVRVSGQDELAQLQRALMSMVEQLKSVVSQVREGVDSVSSASSQIATGNHDLSARTEQTASNLEETASSMEELTGAVGQSADTARQANQLASTAAEAASRGGQVVGAVVQRMGQISESSRKIGDIIGTIDGIAFQTNILALNAAVEAARAGEQGRGFAVVAGEVRTLAQRSAEAAKEIKTLIGRSVETVEAGAADVAHAGEAMQEIVSSVGRVTDLMGEIAAAAVEQRDGIAQVNQAVANLDQMTQQNAALVEESTAASASLSEQAQRLADVVSVFKLA